MTSVLDNFFLGNFFLGNTADMVLQKIVDSVPNTIEAEFVAWKV